MILHLMILLSRLDDVKTVSDVILQRTCVGSKILVVWLAFGAAPVVGLTFSRVNKTCIVLLWL